MFVIWSNAYNQIVQPEVYYLDLADSGRKIENTISLNISDRESKTIQATGEKIVFRTKNLIINGDTLKPEEISTRGQSTLQFKRKSLSFRLTSKASFRHGEKTESCKDFILLSLAMDKYYIHNRLAFGMMEISKIFRLFYSYCDLRINGKSEGIFMIIERPEDWAIKRKNSPLVIRRGYNHNIEKTKTDKKTDKSETKKYLDYYRQIYKCLDKYEGEQLYKTLSGWIDLDNYMKWLAFNLFLRNGDYSDEVFFYIDPDIKKFRIIPWDYDDIFARAPHEGDVENRKVFGNLIFSTEDLLDRKIASDPYLYKIYLARLKEVLDKLSPAVLEMIFENTYAELYPYYSENEIISNSKYDYYKDANLVNLKQEMINLYIGLRVSRGRYIEYLEGIIE